MIENNDLILASDIVILREFTEHCCDDDLVPLYEKFGMMKSNGMLIRNYSMQSGISNE